MNLPDDKHRRSPADRFRKILSAEEKEEKDAATKKTLAVNLPKARPMRETNAPSGPPAPPSGPVSASRSEKPRFLPIFWTVASVLSLLVNLILLILLVSLWRGLGNLNLTSLGPGLVGGLYTNFERMDRAHIQTVIPVQTTIPLDASIPVRTTTAITLAQDVSIQGAHVKINTPLFNIDAPANVTLPAGTSLNVGLNFDLPVKMDVPVVLNVPVDIAMQQTDLHPALLGLEDTIRPLYCMVSPAALSLDGAPVCR